MIPIIGSQLNQTLQQDDKLRLSLPCKTSNTNLQFSLRSREEILLTFHHRLMHLTAYL